MHFRSLHYEFEAGIFQSAEKSQSVSDSPRESNNSDIAKAGAGESGSRRGGALRGRRFGAGESRLEERPAATASELLAQVGFFDQEE